MPTPGAGLGPSTSGRSRPFTPVHPVHMPVRPQVQRKGLSRGHVRCFLASNNGSQTGQGSRSVKISFRIPYRVNYGQQLAIIGSAEPLGNWDPEKPVLMKWSDGDLWSVDLALDVRPSSPVDLEYKYLVRNSDGRISSWKPGSNYKLSFQPTPDKVVCAIKVADAWDDSFRQVDMEEVPVLPAQPAPPPAPAPAAHVPPQQKASAGLKEQKQANSPKPPSQPTRPSNGTSQPTASSAASAVTNGKHPAASVATNGKPPAAAAATNGKPPTEQPASSTSRPAATTATQSTAPGTPGTLPPPPTPPPTSKLPEQERLEEGIRKSLQDLQTQMDVHQQLRERTQDPAAMEVLVADRIVAAANNKVLAYNKALKAVEAYAQLPTNGANEPDVPRQ